MSYVNEQTSNLADLISKLNTFLSGTPGWTTHHVPASGEFAARKSGSGYDIGFASQWDTGSPNNLGIYQFLGAYNSGAAPYAQADDSGNGAATTTDANLDDARHVVLTNTPLQYWAFEDDHYFHVVVQIDSTRYRHFGAGQLDKFNDWSGGEYVYGFRQESAFSSDNAIQPGSTILLDGGAWDSSPPTPTNMEEYVATMHVESLDGQPAGGKYAVCMGNQGSSNLGNDRQAAPKARIHMVGGFRAGLGVPVFGQMAGTYQKGLMPGYRIMQYYWRRDTGNVYGPLGVMKDVIGVSIKNFNPGDEVTIGSDTWVLFPSFRKSPDPNTINGYSGYQGIAYKKVTT